MWQLFTRLLKRKHGQTPRAPRIPAESPVRFRPFGQIEWSKGITYDVSPTGLLFRSNRVMDVHAMVQINFVAPVEIAGKQGALVICHGQIVRTVMPAVSDGQGHLAARILEYLPGAEWKPGLRRIRQGSLPSD
jgi:hypothetical protein